MGVISEILPARQTNVTGTSAVPILPAQVGGFTDLLSLTITTTNAVAGTLIINDGNKNVMVLNYPNVNSVPVSPLVIDLSTSIEQSGAGNASWTATASANANGYSISAQYRNR